MGSVRSAQASLVAAEYWVARANEARVQAEQTRDPDARRELLRIVEGYIRMAMLATGKLDQGTRWSPINRLN
jgi:hypothetical protein